MRNKFKNMSIDEVCDYLYDTNNLHKVQGCPTQATEDGELLMYCPDGRVFYRGEEVEFDNPFITLGGVDITLPLLEMAEASGLDMLIATPITF